MYISCRALRFASAKPLLRAAAVALCRCRRLRDTHQWRRVQTLCSKPWTGALAHKATGFSAKLLKRGDQCRAVLACAHLFWQAADGGGGGGGGESAEAAAEVRAANQHGSNSNLSVQRLTGLPTACDLRQVAQPCEPSQPPSSRLLCTQECCKCSTTNNATQLLSEVCRQV